MKLLVTHNLILASTHLIRYTHFFFRSGYRFLVFLFLVYSPIVKQYTAFFCKESGYFTEVLSIFFVF